MSFSSCFNSKFLLALRFPWRDRLRKVFKRSRSGRGATIRGWQQFVVRGWAVDLRSRRTSVLGWQQCAVRGRAFGLCARTAFAQ